MNTTTQRTPSLLERLLAGKRRELEEFDNYISTQDRLLTNTERADTAKLKEDIAWMEARLAEREATRG
mgnify:CR=1 FL=1